MLPLFFMGLSSFAADITVVESYNAAAGELPEGVAVSPAGDVFVSIAPTGELRRIDRHTGEGSTFATLPVGGGFLLGMAFNGDDLYVVNGSFDAETCGVWSVSATGETTRVVAFGANEFPNDLTFDADGNLFITESIAGAVWRVPAGSTTRSLFVQDALLFGDVSQSPVPFPIGANGIVYDDDTSSILVANSQVPAVVEIDDNGGVSGDIQVLVSGEEYRGADGLTLDRNGNVIVISNFNSTVLYVERDTGTTTVLADSSDGLVFPATAAFGQAGFDKHSIFITNFGFGAGPDAPVGLLRLEVGVKSEKVPQGR